MAKKIIVVLGSPRKNGNSATLARQVIAGAEASGAEVESFYLHDMDIRPCRACDACQEDIDKNCVMDDDMQILYPKVRAADVIVIASPIYWFTVSAQTKLFIDRCYALGGPQGYALEGKQIGIVLAYGDSDPYNSGAVNAIRTFQDAFNFVGAELAGMVYGSATDAGEIAENQKLMEAAYQLGERLGAAG